MRYLAAMVLVSGAGLRGDGTRENVGDLRMVWSRALHPGTQEGTPLAYGGVLYMPNPRDVIQAIDAVTGGGTVAPADDARSRRARRRDVGRRPVRGP